MKIFPFFAIFYSISLFYCTFASSNNESKIDYIGSKLELLNAQLSFIVATEIHLSLTDLFNVCSDIKTIELDIDEESFNSLRTSVNKLTSGFKELAQSAFSLNFIGFLNFINILLPEKLI